MYRNKKKHFRIRLLLVAGVSLVLFSGVFLTGCDSKRKVLSDIGTDLPEEKDAAEYLDRDVLSEKKEYRTHVLSCGTYTEEAAQTYGNRVPFIRQPITVETGGYKMRLINRDMLYGYHEAGSLLVTVSMDIDPVDVREAGLKLQRLKERYERDQQEFLEQREKDIAKNDQIGDKYEFEAGCIRLEQKVLEWENRARLYEQQIREAEQTAAELEKWSKLTEITAPVSGIYWSQYTNAAADMDPEQYKYIASDLWANGDELSDGEILCSRLFYEDCIFALENPSEKYHYGMEFSWQVYDWQDATKITETAGRVVNATADDLYGNLENDNVCFKLDITEEMAEQFVINYNKGKMSGNLCTMKNVLLVPAEAVTEEKGVCYVTVVKEDGSFLKTGFIPGGSNGETYWVLEGLEEGMQVLLKNS